MVYYFKAIKMTANLIVILGATASGKTRLAARLAQELKSEIISADSRQVYKGMNVGTGKDLEDYLLNGRSVPHHLIDIIGPEEEFSLFAFQTEFYEIYAALIQKKVLPVLVGGSGLYLESIIQNYQLPPAPLNHNFRNDLHTKSMDELREMLGVLKHQQHNKTDAEDKGRLIRAIEIERARQKQPAGGARNININAAIFGIRWERTLLRKRITARLEQRLKQGMIEEVKALQTNGLSWARLDSFGLEYRYISQFLQHKVSYEEMFAKLNTSIHQFAKRQETWFRRMERKGIIINWINGDDYKLLKESVIKYL